MIGFENLPPEIVIHHVLPVLLVGEGFLDFLSLASTCHFFRRCCSCLTKDLDQAVKQWCQTQEFPFQKKLDVLIPSPRDQYVWIKRYLKTLREAPDRGLIAPRGDPR